MNISCSPKINYSDSDYRLFTTPCTSVSPSQEEREPQEQWRMLPKTCWTSGSVWCKGWTGEMGAGVMKICHSHLILQGAWETDGSSHCPSESTTTHLPKTYCPWDSPSQWLNMVEVLRAGPLWLDMKFYGGRLWFLVPLGTPAKSPLYLPYSLVSFYPSSSFPSLFPKVSDQSHSVKSLLLLPHQNILLHI